MNNYFVFVVEDLTIFYAVNISLELEGSTNVVRLHTTKPGKNIQNFNTYKLQVTSSI